MTGTNMPTRRTILCSGLLLAAAAFFAPAADAQQPSSKPSSPKDTSAPRPAMTPAEAAACSQIVGYAFQNPAVVQQFERFKASGQSKVLQDMPDSLRPRVASAVSKGQRDSLQAIARQQVGPQNAPAFDEMINFVVAFPDSIRRSMGLLLASGKPISCMP